MWGGGGEWVVEGLGSGPGGGRGLRKEREESGGRRRTGRRRKIDCHAGQQQLDPML